LAVPGLKDQGERSLKQINLSSGLQTLVLLLAITCLLTACGPAASPADAITEYLQALADKDQTGAVSKSCAAWEEQALAEGNSFVNVQVSLEDLACQVVDETGSDASVTCTGRYLFSYDAGEDQELDLSGRVFSAIKESGEWRMCGYK
jgi:hypothetical protein